MILFLVLFNMEDLSLSRHTLSRYLEYNKMLWIYLILFIILLKMKLKLILI